MKEGNKMKHIIRLFILIAALVLGADYAWASAPSNPRVKFVYESEHGSAFASAADANRLVTITVTPNGDYRCIAGDLTAEQSVNSNKAETPRRSPGVGQPVAVTCTETNKFTLTLPEDEMTNVTVYVKFSSKVPLTVTANNKNIEYGDEPANNGVTYSGFEGTDDASVLSGTLSFDYTYNQFDPVGTYSITPKGLTSDNYAITFVPGTLTVNQVATIEVTWKDGNNPGSLRPESLNFRLLANGVETERTVTLNESNNWTATENGLTPNNSGNLIQYTWILVSTPETLSNNYESGNPTQSTTNTGAEAIFTYTQKTSATVKIVWDDANDQDGIRPTEMTATLSDGSEYNKTVTLNSTNSWTATVENLPKYNGNDVIDYNWTQDVNALPEGYASTDPSIDGIVTTITNSHTPEVTQVKVSKVWDDENNVEGFRPESVTVHLMKGETEVEYVELNTGNEWTHTWSNLQKYENGTAINYTVTEDPVANYSTQITKDDGSFTYTVTNTAINVSGNCGQTSSDNVMWHYGLTTKALTISGTGAMMYYGLTSDNLHSTAPWSHFDSEIETVVVEDGVTSVGAYAFAFCSALTSVSLPTSVFQIDQAAFYNSNVIRVDIPRTTEVKLGINAFNYCPAALQIAVPAHLLKTYKEATNWSAYEAKMVGVLDDAHDFNTGEGTPTGRYEYSRTFNEGVAATICLPFEVSSDQISSYGQVYTFDGVDKSGEKWEVVMKEANKASGALTAYKPYMFLPYIFNSKGTNLPLKFSGNVASLAIAGTDNWEEDHNTGSFWSFQGVTYYYVWNDGNANLGKVYGFASQSHDGGTYTVSPGDFVKAAAGASIAPFRAFLQYTPSNSAKRRGADTEALPSRMSVRLVNADGTATVIDNVSIENGKLTIENEADAWYTLDGRRLNSTPGTRGIYIKNGKKIILK